MHRYKNKYVEVGGRGIINEGDCWEKVHVERVTDRPDGRNSFSLEEFLSNPNPKIFDPDNMITIEMSDEEWEIFDKAIRESRNR